MKEIFFALALAAFAAIPAGAKVTSDKPNQALDELQKAAQVEELPAAAAEVAAEPVADRFWIKVQASSREDRTAIATAGMAIEEEGSGQVAGTAHIKTIEKLQALGFKVTYRVSLQKLLKDFPSQDKVYHNYDRMKAALDALVSAAPDMVSLFSIGKGWQGRDIWAVRFNNTESGTAPSKKPGAFIVGDHHAREHLSVEMPIKIAEYLAAHRADPAVRKLLETRDIYIVPMLNPDGAEYDISTGRYQMHRKNMRINPDKEIGVDLNRNCDSFFGGAGSSGDTYSDVYHGPSAFSEPETMALKNFLDARTNIKTINSFHSYSGLIMYPWGGKEGAVENAADLKAFQAMAGAMAKLAGLKAQQSNVMYVATGDCMDWAYAAHHMYAFTTELNGGSFYPGAAEIDKETPGEIKAALYMIEYSDDPRRAAANLTATN